MTFRFLRAWITTCVHVQLATQVQNLCASSKLIQAFKTNYTTECNVYSPLNYLKHPDKAARVHLSNLRMPDTNLELIQQHKRKVRKCLVQVSTRQQQRRITCYHGCLNCSKLSIQAYGHDNNLSGCLTFAVSKLEYVHLILERRLKAIIFLPETLKLRQGFLPNYCFATT